MKLQRYIAVVGVSCALLTIGVTDESRPVVGGRPLKVGMVVSPPFVMKNTAGQWEGIVVGLWEGMAKSLGCVFEYVELDYPQVFKGLRTGELAVGLGRFVPTAELNKQIGFTHAYYSSGLAVGVGEQGEYRHWRQVFQGFRQSAFLDIILMVMAWLFAFGLILWWVEHKRNQDHFGGSIISGIGSALWWSASTLTSVGYGDKVPITFVGRLIALLAMLFGIVLFAGFTATVTSLITASRLQSQVDDVRDLKRWNVGVVTNTVGANYLRQQQVPCEVFRSTEAVLQALIAGKLDAVVHDLPVLQYYARQKTYKAMDVLPNRFFLESYTLAIPRGSALRQRLNTALLDQIDKPAWNEVLFNYRCE